MTANAKHVIAYIRPTARHGESAQRTAMASLAPAREVVDVRDGSGFDKVARAVRAGDEVVVAHTHLLGPTIEQIAARMLAVHARGGCVVEIATGRRSDQVDDAIMMVAGARHQLAGERKTHSPAEAKRKGKLGAAARGKWLDQFSAATRKDLRAIWRSRDYGTNAEALAAMDERGGVPGWSIMLAWRAFGMSGRQGGRRKVKREAQ